MKLIGSLSRFLHAVSRHRQMCSSEADFAVLELPISRCAKRAVKRTAGTDNVTSAGLKERTERLAVDQFL